MIRNFRDLSVYRNKNGKQLMEGQFLRSAALVNLKKKDLNYINKYLPLTVIDLRTEIERNEQPDYQFEAYYAVSLIKDSTAGISHDKESDKSIETKIPNMTELYSNFIRDDFSVNKISKVFSIICDPDRKGSILWHCTEGKDRCGLISALFLKMMDYDDKVIFEDYLKSSKSSSKKAMKYYWLIRIFKKNKSMATVVKNAYSAKREYLEAAFQEIENKYGGFDNFFEAIGITEEVKIRMQKRYLKK